LYQAEQEPSDDALAHAWIEHLLPCPYVEHCVAPVPPDADPDDPELEFFVGLSTTCSHADESVPHH
jgi:hypothetical protein